MNLFCLDIIKSDLLNSTVTNSFEKKKWQRKYMIKINRNTSFLIFLYSQKIESQQNHLCQRWSRYYHQ